MAYYTQCGRNILRQIVKDKNFCSLDRIAHPLLCVGQGFRYRKLEVILTTVRIILTNYWLIDYVCFNLVKEFNIWFDYIQSIDKLGKAGETVAVAPGYFRNYLMPKLLAVPNIEKFAHLIREQRKVCVLFLSLLRMFANSCLIYLFN